MTLAAGRLCRADSERQLGSVFAATRYYALTALHCVRDGHIEGAWYAIRARLRGESSAKLEETLTELSRSPSALDRSVALLAQIVRGKTDPVRSLEDGDPSVRRAAAMGAPRRRSRIVLDSV